VSRGQGFVCSVCVCVRDSVFRFSRPAGNYYSFLEPLNIIVFIINMYDLNFEPYLPPTYSTVYVAYNVLYQPYNNICRGVLLYIVAAAGPAMIRQHPC
jgi:hypothetical protein